MAKFTMPSLGADMDEGTLLEWLVKPGDVVKKGDIVAVVDTAKAAVEIETFHDGTFTELLIEPGTKVPVGTPIATLETDAEESPVDGETFEADAAGPPQEPPGGAGRLETAPAMPAQAAPAESGGKRRARAKVSPAARRLAAELGVDIDRLWERLGRPVKESDVRAAAAPVLEPPSETDAARPPRGPHGEHARRPVQISPLARKLAHQLGVDVDALWERLQRPIKESDVRAAATATSTPATPPTAAPQPVTRSAGEPSDTQARAEAMRTAIANLMARSKREIPHYYLQTTVDLETALAWMHQRNLELSVSERLVPAALLLKATALAVAQTPELNGYWVDGAFQQAERVNLGVAVSLRGGGLVAPAIHDAAALTLTELMAAMKDLVMRARSGRLRGSELTDGTITVTNLGEQGVELVHGVIYPPQVALVGFGKPALRPWIVGGGLAPRTVTELTLAADHRASDGFVGSRLLDRIDHHLQQPEQL